jgi:hypothetical protein
MQNSVLDCTYSMHLGWPWLCDVKISHDWGTNIIIIHGNGMVKTIVGTKHLRMCCSFLMLWFSKWDYIWRRRHCIQNKTWFLFLSYYSLTNCLIVWTFDVNRTWIYIHICGIKSYLVGFYSFIGVYRLFKKHLST